MLGLYAHFAALMGHFDQAVAAARRAVLLNPLDSESHRRLGEVLEAARRYDKAITALNDALAIAPGNAYTHAHLGFIYYALGDLERSRSICEIKLEHFVTQDCLATTYEKLGRHRDAQAELAKLRASAGDAGAFLYAEIYAEWGRSAEALEWLDTAVRLRSPWLLWLKVDSSLDPLRKEPRFQAIEQALKFPS